MPLHLVIVTPEKPVLECEADFVTLPAWKGEMGVLPGHTAALVQLGEGVLHYKKGAQRGVFGVAGGFAEIYKDTVSVFAEATELAGEINEETERQAVQKAKKILASRDKSLDLDAANAQLHRSLLRLKVVRRSRPI